jgi:hypothetical protein
LAQEVDARQEVDVMTAAAWFAGVLLAALAAFLTLRPAPEKRDPERIVVTLEWDFGDTLEALEALQRAIDELRERHGLPRAALEE